MRYIVQPGDTLSGIAKAHDITLDHLLALNPALRANPDRIQVGSAIVIDNTTQSVNSPPVGQPSTPQPAAAARELGSLSSRYETSGRGPSTVSSGVGDRGGVSYGSYQMKSQPNGGTVADFVEQKDFPWRDKFASLTPGSSEFTKAWKEIAASHEQDLHNAEHEFIKRTHYDPLCAAIASEHGIDVNSRSTTFQDVVWSTAVQHGAFTDVVDTVFAHMKQDGTFQPGQPGFESDAIRAIYAERGRKDKNGTLVHFKGSSATTQKNVANRFADECKDAIARLGGGA